MHPEDIKAQIRKRGGTLARIAETVTGRQGAHVSKSAVSKVIHGKLKSAAIADAVAKHVGISKTTLWPGTYGRARKAQN